jgi:hypothetical protein
MTASRRKSSVQSFLVADDQNGRPVQPQDLDGRSSFWRNTLDFDAVPAKVFGPNVAARMEEGDAFAGFRIDARLSSFFAQGTRNAGEREIAFAGRAVLRFGDDMVDMKVASCPIWESRQYSHRFPALRMTRRRSWAGT